MDRSLLNKATSSSDEPVPGYYLSEIANMTYATADSCSLVEDYLLKRLARDDPYIKSKALRIIRHLCEKGKSDFKRSIKRKADRIRECQNYTCGPNNITGDAPARSVREEADKTLQILFADSSSAGNEAFLNRIEGFSGSSMPQGGANYSNVGMGSSRGGDDGLYYSSHSSDRITGIGSANFDHNAPMPNAYQRAGNVLKSIGDVAAKYIPSAVTQQFTRHSHSQISHPHAPGGAPYNPSTSHYSAYSSPYSINQAAISTRKPEVPLRSGNEYEAKIVDDLLAPGGAKALLPSSVLTEFCRKCQSLDIEVIAELLVTRYTVRKGSRTAKLRILQVIDGLLKSKGLATNNQKEPFIKIIKKKLLDDIKEDQEVEFLKSRATDVLISLGEEVKPVKEAPVKKQEFDTDLMGDEAAGGASEQKAQEQNNMNDLFDDGTPASNSNTKAPVSPSDDFTSLGINETTNAKSTADTLEMDMMFGDNQTVNTVNQKDVPNTTTGKDNLLDMLFGGTSTGSTAPSSATGTASFMGGVLSKSDNVSGAAAMNTGNLLGTNTINTGNTMSSGNAGDLLGGMAAAGGHNIFGGAVGNTMTVTGSAPMSGGNNLLGGTGGNFVNLMGGLPTPGISYVNQFENSGGFSGMAIKQNSAPMVTNMNSGNLMGGAGMGIGGNLFGGAAPAANPLGTLQNTDGMFQQASQMNYNFLQQNEPNIFGQPPQSSGFQTMGQYNVGLSNNAAGQAYNTMNMPGLNMNNYGGNTMHQANPMFPGQPQVSFQQGAAQIPSIGGSNQATSKLPYQSSNDLFNF